ncbi:MAG: hypothetical protein ACLTSX_09845 [Collinsella sp.]
MPAAYNERVRRALRDLYLRSWISSACPPWASTRCAFRCREHAFWLANRCTNPYISCIDYIDRAMEWANKYEMQRPARSRDRSRWTGRFE